jgi:4'-phosphopantetheinyl transferase
MQFQIVHPLQKNVFPVIVTWQTHDSTFFLEGLLNKHDKEGYKSQSFKLEKRRREWLKTRILLDHVRPGSKLSFLPNGKPVLNDEHHVSISHSDEMAAVIIHHKPVGIDIQEPDEKLSKIRTRFCHASELNFLQNGNEMSMLAMIWSAKEAVFKSFGEGVEFASDMVLRPFSISDEWLYLDYDGKHGKSEFQLHHHSSNGFHVVATT